MPRVSCICGESWRARFFPPPRPGQDTSTDQSRFEGTQTTSVHRIHFVDPFWKDLPHCDIFSCFTPDILHQLHKGVFNDHVSEWAISATSVKRPEINRRFKAMPSHPSLRHFKSGISHVSQWTGTERKEMEKVFLGTILNVSSELVIRTVRHLLDFIYLAHYETHMDKTLQQLEQAWEKFTQAKQIFLSKGVRKNFDIPKIHSM